MTLRRRRIAWHIVYLAFIVTSDARAVEAPIVFTMPSYPDFVYAPVTIGGTDHLCCIDSGATGYFFHTTLRDKLGTPVREAQAAAADGEKFPVEVYSTPVVRIGSIELEREALTGCFNMSLLREMEGRNVEGMIGVPLFRSMIVQFDFDRRQLVLLPRSTQPEKDWGRSTEVTYVGGGAPSIRVELGDKAEGQFIVDTGFTESLTVESDGYLTLVKVGILREVGDYTAIQANGIRTNRQARLSQMKVAGFESHGLLATEGGKQSRISLKYLRRFKVTFDLSNDRIFFAKGEAFDMADKKPMFGLATLRKQDRSVIELVWPDSPAEKAGIIAGDELVSVAGILVNDKPLPEVRWLMTEKVKQSGSVVLIVSRGGKQRSLTIEITE